MAKFLNKNELRVGQVIYCARDLTGFAIQLGIARYKVKITKIENNGFSGHYRSKSIQTKRYRKIMGLGMFYFNELPIRLAAKQIL